MMDDPFTFGSSPLDISKPRKLLLVELVPSGAWKQNLRTQVLLKVWNQIKKNACRRAGYTCEVCGDSGRNQGRKWPVECHEIWEYDDTQHIQKLIGITVLCPRCHEVKHAGRTISVSGKEGLKGVVTRLMALNMWTEKQAVEHLQKAFQLWEKRSSYKWTLDLSWVLPEGSSEPPLE